MHYLVSLSGGIASAVAADRAIARYGRAKVRLWFADTMWESDELYRFRDQCMQRWGGRLYTFRDGRNPLEVSSDKSLIPSPHTAPCTRVLKIEPFRAMLYRMPKPITVLLGLDWSEMHRITERNTYHRKQGKPRKPTGYHHQIAGVYEDYPLLWQPYEFRPYAEVVRSWGIEPSAVYAAGAGHDNCGGACVKQGIGDWVRLYDQDRARFELVRDWEQAQRAKGGARANRAILRDSTGGTTRPMTLAELEQRIIAGQTGRRAAKWIDSRMQQQGIFGCMCAVESAG